MTGQSRDRETRLLGRAGLTGFWLLFLLFAANILIAKTGLTWLAPLPFGGVIEALLLLFAMACLMVAALARERTQ